MGANILVVEDETIVAMELSRRITSMGHRVLGPVGSVQEALALADADEPIDLALLDVRLRRNGSGADLAMQLRARHTIPAVFLTAYSDDSTLERIKRCEPLGYLLKPLDERALWVTIETALHTHEMAQRRAQAERAQQRSDALYRAILNHSHDAIVLVDAEQRIAVYNEGAALVFGYAPAEALGQDVSLLLPEGLPAPTDRAQGTIVELQGRRRDASAFPAEVSISSVHIGEERMCTAIIRDLQERRALEARVAQAERFEALGRLAGGIAHDFNNLLTAILGYTRLLQGSFDLGDPRRQDICEIEAAGERASKLVRELLSCSSHKRLKRDPVRVNALLLGIQNLLRTLLGDGCELHLHLEPDLPQVLTDTNKLEQVFVNLVVNARDASQVGSTVTVETRMARSDEREALSGLQDDQDAVVIGVRDAGSGMDEATRRRIFEPFFTTKQTTGGTGLGLATAYGAVRQSGGEILVDTAPGCGTLIRVVLPTAANARLPRCNLRQAIIVHSPTVLLVDDEPLVREITARLLRDAGYGVVVASDADEAWQLVEALDADLDLLLSDVAMPGADGFELAKRWRTRFPDKPVVMMSGFADGGPTSLREDPGAAWVAKPFDPAALNQLIGAMLSRTSSMPAQAAEIAG